MKDISVTLDFWVAESGRFNFLQTWSDAGPYFSRKSRDNTYLWRIDSECSTDAELIEHLRSILGKLDAVKLAKINQLADVRSYLNIAIYHDNANCSIDMPYEMLNLLSGTYTNIEVSCYPCVDEN
ncbi:MAG: hypothetical protein JWN23_2586 [Rhodocyclales bacterium]|nr:hypothetical protein [Rhodocyclales bacterium]